MPASSSSVLAALLLLGSPHAAAASNGSLRGSAGANVTTAPAASTIDTVAPPRENLTDALTVSANGSAAAAAMAGSSLDPARRGDDLPAASDVAANVSAGAAATESFFDGVEASQSAANASEALEASAEWRRGGRRHGHYHSTRSSRSVMTLYHTTSPQIARQILASSFRPGSSGWCGGAIYFTDVPYLKPSKRGPDTKTGAVIQARVDMGRMARMDRRCSSTFGRGLSNAMRHGYDSVRFNPGDGNEYVIASAHRVLSMRRYK